jgi:hypothetical protein
MIIDTWHIGKKENALVESGVQKGLTKLVKYRKSDAQGEGRVAQ